MAKKTNHGKLQVEAITHQEATRSNIPTAEYQPLVPDDQRAPIRVAYERRNRDLDPQLVWRGKDQQDWSDLVVQAPPIYIQEKIHPKVLIDDLRRRTEADRQAQSQVQDLFGYFDAGIREIDRTEFYQHDQNWTNRMVLGDSLEVMASLAEREGLRGKVQCIYFDPPYGIKFNSNFQWSTTSNKVADGKADQITREPEQVKAFRDTWRDGIHSYLTYLRDRLTAARELLTETGSLFIQIGSENQHLVRSLCDEIFGVDNFMEVICFKTRMALGGRHLEGVFDYIIWYAKSKEYLKFRRLFYASDVEGDNHWNRYIDEYLAAHSMTGDQVSSHKLLPRNSRIYQLYALYPVGPFATGIYDFVFEGKQYSPPPGRSWKSPFKGMERIARSSRIERYASGQTLRYRLFLDDYPVSPRHNIWSDTAPPADKVYVVQTAPEIIKRCLLMTTDPGDLVLDPTCGSGTTAYVAEQWGRRWITIDTSRVALALARSRLMGARYPYYLLADSAEGQQKEAEVSRKPLSSQLTRGNIRHGFVYERVPHITLGSIANNAEIDVIWENWQPRVQGALERLNAALRGHKSPYRVTVGGREGKEVKFDAPQGATFAMPSGETVPAYELVDWEVPRQMEAGWPSAAQKPLEDFWAARIGRQKEIDASIAARADFEFLYDKPYSDNKRVRVAGPFTVESVSPHRMLAVGPNGETIDPAQQLVEPQAEGQSFVQMVLENLRAAGVQQAHKQDKVVFDSLVPWPGHLICAEGRYSGEEGRAVRAGIFIGPEFGTVQRADLVEAAREAGEAGFDVLVSCAFSYDAHSSELSKLGRIRVLKARMNADLHMAKDLKTTGAGNLFVIFGEPDIELTRQPDGQLVLRVLGVDVFVPQTGEIRSDNADGLACWFVDTDYNGESFFVRQAYFLGANDPYKALKVTLKSEIDEEAWRSLNSDTSRPFAPPASGRIAVKVINHLGDEVMKVFQV